MSSFMIFENVQVTQCYDLHKIGTRKIMMVMGHSLVMCPFSFVMILKIIKECARERINSVIIYCTFFFVFWEFYVSGVYSDNL